MDISNAPNTSETDKVMAYIDAGNPGIKSLKEFFLANRDPQPEMKFQ